MKISQFEDSFVWQKSQDLAIELKKLILDTKDFSYRDQIMRAVISISNNIAEWFERRSNKELRQFLFIAKWSCGEVRSMIYLGYCRKYYSEEEYTRMKEKCLEISRMLSSRIKTL